MDAMVVAALMERVKLGDVFWNDTNGSCLQVERIETQWKDDNGENHTAVAVLRNGSVISLLALDVSAFVVLYPCMLSSYVFN